MMNVHAINRQIQPLVAQVKGRGRRNGSTNYSYKALRERLQTTFLCGCLQAELARGGMKVAPQFVKLLGDRHEKVRGDAAKMLGHLCAKHMADALCRSKVAPALFRRSWDRSIYVREAVAEALGDMKYRKAFSTLSRLKRDRNSRVRAAALEAIASVAKAESGRLSEIEAQRESDEEDALALLSFLESALLYLVRIPIEGMFGSGK